jgi:hypothetical protein
MRAERNAVFLHLAQLRQRHDLEPARVGKDRVRPIHELVQAPKHGNSLRAGTQHEMVGVGKNNIGAACAHGLGRKALHGRLRSDRHEGGRRHLAVRRLDHAATGGAVACRNAKGEGFRHAGFQSRNSRQASP